ncbi:MAG: DUF4365 domain-containing protein [Ruminiclostridium sp.]
MPNMKWFELSRLQLGRYAEYYAKMEFASYGFEVYTSEVDDHGVDFVAKYPNTSVYYEIQVKGIGKSNYVFETKDKMPLSETRILCLLYFQEGKLPDIYLIPSLEWLNPNGVLVDRNYDKPGQKSKPEWGINVNPKNLPALEKYSASRIFETLIPHKCKAEKE